MVHVVDLVGQKFGRLVVICRAYPVKSDIPGIAFWDCLCDCGGTKTTRGYSLRRGQVRSCGCLKAEAAWDHPTKYQSPEDAAWYFNWSQYKRNIRHRGLEMEFTFDEFKSLCLQPCFYCGALPERRPSQRGRASILASGIDRVDNSKGYIMGNVVSCCTWCNRTKNKGPAEDFIIKCTQVANAAIARRE